MKKSTIDTLIRELEGSNFIEYFAKNANDDSVNLRSEMWKFYSNKFLKYSKTCRKLFK